MSHRNDPDGTAPGIPADAQVGEDLVAFALGQLSGEQADRVRESVAGDPAVARRFDSIRLHLDLHARVREIQPSPGGFERLRARLEADGEAGAPRPAAPAAGDKPRSFLQRYWLSVAAAALLLVAVFLPRGVMDPDPTRAEVTALAGQPVEDPAGNWCSAGVSRIAYGDGITVTLDADTTITPLARQRLALRAGRIFVEVEPGRQGFAVDIGGGRITTLGTSFLVEATPDRTGAIACRVAVEKGRVAYQLPSSDGHVAADDELRWTTPADAGQPPRVQPLAAGARLRWFRIPSLSAKILNDRTVVVVIRNEMLDPIQLAPPTGGDPLFYATVGNHSYPHEPANFGRNVVLEPGTEFTFEMKLPQPLEPGQELIIRCPSLGLQAPLAGLPTSGSGTENGR